MLALYSLLSGGGGVFTIFVTMSAGISGATVFTVVAACTVWPFEFTALHTTVISLTVFDRPAVFNVAEVARDNQSALRRSEAVDKVASCCCDGYFDRLSELYSLGGGRALNGRNVFFLFMIRRLTLSEGTCREEKDK
jgi:hypothetical protein